MLWVRLTQPRYSPLSPENGTENSASTTSRVANRVAASRSPSVYALHSPLTAISGAGATGFTVVVVVDAVVVVASVLNVDVGSAPSPEPVGERGNPGSVETASTDVLVLAPLSSRVRAVTVPATRTSRAAISPRTGEKPEGAFMKGREP